MKPLRILLVEDHFLPRFAVKTLLEREADFQVVAEAETGWQAVAAFREHKPDLILMDLRLPEMDGHSAISAILREDSKARVLVLSNYESEEDVARALQLGAMGYLRKDADAPQILLAIRTVARGDRYLPETAQKVLADVDPSGGLSLREREIVQLVFKGLTNAQIGQSLGITEGTVRIHMTNIMFKLGVKRRTEAVAVALKKGIVRPES